MPDTLTAVQTRPGPQRCEIAITCSSERAWVTVTGALDVASSCHLEAVIHQLCCDHRAHITLDVGAVTSVHCLAVAALSRAEQQACTHGGSLTLVDPTALGRRLRALLHPN